MSVLTVNNYVSYSLDKKTKVISFHSVMGCNSIGLLYKPHDLKPLKNGY